MLCNKPETFGLNTNPGIVVFQNAAIPGNSWVSQIRNFIRFHTIINFFVIYANSQPEDFLTREKLSERGT
jgi:hypothetical protein